MMLGSLNGAFAAGLWGKAEEPILLAGGRGDREVPSAALDCWRRHERFHLRLQGELPEGDS
jgi:hypothetical protein